MLAQELARRSARAPKRRDRTKNADSPRRTRTVAPDGPILDTASRPRPRAGREDQEIRSDDAPIAEAAPVSAPDPDPLEKRASRTDSNR